MDEKLKSQMKYQLKVLLLTCLLFFTQVSWAWPPLYGAEFTFTNNAMMNEKISGNIVNSPQAEKAQTELKELIKERCAGCTMRVTSNSYGVKTYKFTYPDGFWFVVATDPGCLEIQTKPSTYAQYKKYKNIIQSDLFDSAASLGMFSDKDVGGGHIHIGMKSAFDGDAVLFRNFVADYANHGELNSGIMDNDRAKAPILDDLNRNQRKAFKELLFDFDNGKAKVKTIKGFAKSLEKEVYYKTPMGWDPSFKYQALNVHRVYGDEFSEAARTVEIRAQAAQKTFEDYLKQIQLYEKRIKFLSSKETKRIIYLDEGPELTGRDKVEQFYAYVTESGLDWNDYKYMLPKRLQSMEPQGTVKTQFIKLADICDGHFQGQ